VVKLREDLLQELLNLVYSPDTRVIIGPKFGEDAAIIDVVGLRYLVTHTDPITGACEYLGWLAVIVPSNDVAVEGGTPRWCEIALLLPEGIDDDSVRKIFLQVKEASVDVGVSIIGGHTEYSPGIERPIAVSTCIGVSDRYIPTGGAKPGDLILIAKSPAIEAALILVSDFKDKLLESGFTDRELRKIELFRKELSLVREAVAIRDLVSSMHDPTEGGVLQGLYEIARASNVAIEIWLDEVKIRPEIKRVLDIFGLDPLRSLSSGTLIATVSPDNIDEAIRRLSHITSEISIIGRVLERAEKPCVIVRQCKGGPIIDRIESSIPDQIMMLWSKIGELKR